MVTKQNTMFFPGSKERPSKASLFWKRKTAWLDFPRLENVFDMSIRKLGNIKNWNCNDTLLSDPRKVGNLQKALKNAPNDQNYIVNKCKRVFEYYFIIVLCWYSKWQNERGFSSCLGFIFQQKSWDSHVYSRVKGLSRLFIILFWTSLFLFFFLIIRYREVKGFKNHWKCR